MLHVLDTLRGTGLAAISLKMFLAAFLGGCIGMEREYKQRAAGFRTHILISVGAAMTMITSQFLVFDLKLSTDPGRLGAQVVAGIGFIGAGSIIVSKRNRVKGLTTAAGLWVTAIVGLVTGAGFYECSVLVTTLILFTEMVLSKLEYLLRERIRDIDLYVEYNGSGYLLRMVEFFKQNEIKMTDMEVIKNSEKKGSKKVAMFTVQMRDKSDGLKLAEEISKLPGTIVVEIL